MPMQTEYGYGFLLKAPADYPEEDYQELKYSIEQLCDGALRKCRSCGAENLNFAILSKNSIFVTVSVHSGKAEFAIYNKEEHQIIQECSICELKKYVSPSLMEALAMRIENECNAILKGSILNRKTLDDAWSEKYERERLEQDGNREEEKNRAQQEAEQTEGIGFLHNHRRGR